MPELPEVETIITDLRSRILDIEISDIEVLLPRIVSPSNFKSVLTGKSFAEITRVGKYIIIQLDPAPSIALRADPPPASKQGKKLSANSLFSSTPLPRGRTGGGLYLIIHLKMTGQLIYKNQDNVVAGGHSDNNDPTQVPNKWTRVVFSFADGGRLYFNDLRTFGYLKIVDYPALQDIISKIGIDPVLNDLDFGALSRKIKQRKTPIKAVLLDQKLITGLGNIYVDEVLFLSGIRPQTQANKLSIKKIHAILENIKPVLMLAIKNRGTTFNNYVDGQGKKGKMTERLQVYGRGGKKCHKCGNIIKKIKVAGRGTHYCSFCQK